MNEVSTYGHIPEKFIKQPQDSCIKMVSMQFHHDEIEEWKVLNRNKKTSNHRLLLGFYPPSEALIIFGRVMKGVESWNKSFKDDIRIYARRKKSDDVFIAFGEKREMLRTQLW